MQISKKQQCLTVCAVNGLKKEQFAWTDGAEEPRRALQHHLQQEPVKHEAPPKLSPAAAVISHIHRFQAAFMKTVSPRLLWNYNSTINTTRLSFQWD